ncbi:hypothetical protein ACA910_003930 [Epithemia clementina (nom. ined.)]
MLVNNGNNMDDNNDLEASQNKQQHAWLQQQHQPNQHQNAMKQIHAGANPEIQQACLEEANIHHAAHHYYFMPLLGFLKTSEYC